MLVDRGSLLRKVSDRQLTSENINFNSISNMIYGISSMIYGIGASIDISVRSVLRESRPGFPARGHDSESKRILGIVLGNFVIWPLLVRARAPQTPYTFLGPLAPPPWQALTEGAGGVRFRLVQPGSRCGSLVPAKTTHCHEHNRTSCGLKSILRL